MDSAKKRIEATTGISASAVIAPEIADDIRFFEENGFVGPIRLYDQDEAAEMLRSIRIDNQNTDKILYANNMNYDRHFDIPEMSRHICHPQILKYLKGISRARHTSLAHRVLCKVSWICGNRVASGQGLRLYAWPTADRPDAQ